MSPAGRRSQCQASSLGSKRRADGLLGSGGQAHCASAVGFLLVAGETSRALSDVSGCVHAGALASPSGARAGLRGEG